MFRTHPLSSHSLAVSPGNSQGIISSTLTWYLFCLTPTSGTLCGLNQFVGLERLDFLLHSYVIRCVVIGDEFSKALRWVLFYYKWLYWCDPSHPYIILCILSTKLVDAVDSLGQHWHFLSYRHYPIKKKMQWKGARFPTWGYVLSVKSGEISRLITMFIWMIFPFALYLFSCRLYMFQANCKGSNILPDLWL